MKNKFIRISDFYHEILELCDYYNLEEPYERLVTAIFRMAISCALQRQDWKYSDYFRLYDVLIVKDEFEKILKALFRGEI